MKTVKIGDKPVKFYTSVALKLLRKNNRILIIARGKHISKAVDLLEILKRTLKIKIQKLNTKTLILETGNVSQIEIEVSMNEN